MISHLDEEKKKLLTFSTGSERVPAGGLAKLKFVIVKQVLSRHVRNSRYREETQIGSQLRIHASTH